jgi:hypothetical protein
MELGDARWLGSGGGAGELGRLEVGDGTDSWGPVDRVTWERRLTRKARLTRGLDGPAGTVSACGGDTASGRAGPEAKWATRSAGPKSRKRISELEIGFLNLPRL